MDHNIDRLRAELRAVWDNMKTIADRVNASGTMSDADKRAYHDHEARYDELATEIERLTGATAHKNPAWSDAVRGSTRSGSTGVDTAFREVVYGDRRTVDLPVGTVLARRVEQRGDMTTTSLAGAVPTGVLNEVQQVLVNTHPLLRVARIINTDDGAPLRLPTFTANPVGSAVSEGGTIPEDDPTQSYIEWDAYKFGVLTQASTELLTDSRVDLAPEIARALGASVGSAVAAKLTTGSGSSEPQGFVTAGSAAVTGGTGVSGKPTADNLIDLLYEVEPAYRQDARACAWIMSNSAWKAVRKLTNTSGDYLVQPGLNGNPDTLLGYPVYVDTNMAAVGTGAKSIAFGNWGRAVGIRMAGPMRVERSDDYGYANDLATWRALIRVDARVTDANAYRLFVGGTA